MSARKSSHRTIFLIVSSGSPLALIASSLRSTSKKPFCPMTRSLHPPITACGHRVRFVGTWREEFFEVPPCLRYVLLPISPGRTNEGAGGGRGTGIQHSPSWGQRSQVPKLPWRAHVGPTRSVNLPDVRFTSNSYRA